MGLHYMDVAKKVSGKREDHPGCDQEGEARGRKGIVERCVIIE